MCACAQGAYYTLILTDPDAPSRAEPKLREWVHWVRVNIPGDNLPCDGEDGGDDLKTYVGSAPPADTGTCLGDSMGLWLVGEGVWREVCARPFGTERKEPQEGWATGR